MKSGANYVVLAKLNIDIANVDEVIFTFVGKKKVTKYYPSDVSYNDGVFAIPLLQDDTELLEGSVRVEAQINYSDRSVQKSDVAELYIASTLATRKVENDNPSGTNTKEVEFSIVGNAIIAKIEGDIDPADIEKAVKDYLDEHPVQAGISAEECYDIVSAFFSTHKEELKGEKGDRGEQGIQGIQGIQGERGADGKDGKDGTNGQDGYTPIKGKDYFDGKNGYTPVKGIDYFDGQNGKDGQDGQDGKTPVKGTDYWTATDKAEIVADVISALPTAESEVY